MNRARALVWLSLGVLAAACWQSQPPVPAAFGIDRVSPPLGSKAEPLLLNDGITVYFTAEVHPLSVTEDAISVFDADGHPVPGTLKTGDTWVTFTPDPPMDPSLTDGSFRPAEHYRLVVAGYPRPDGVRAADGRRLDAMHAFALRTAGPGPYGDLPAPLRPPGTDLPFMLAVFDPPQLLPADAPTLRLHFMLPVLPETARPEAFAVQLVSPGRRRRLEPRTARIVPSPLDQFAGSTIEIDLGAEPRVIDGGPPVSLRAGDWLSVEFCAGENALRDLAGNTVLPGIVPFWTVSAGSSVTLMSWPSAEGGIVSDDPLWPGFESISGLVQPRVRAEIGSGSLGSFRPQVDTVLRPGQAFDRGDGVMVRSDDVRFPFLAIDVPPGVEVRVEGEGTQLLACGGIRIAGRLVLAGASTSVPALQHGAAVAELADQSPVALIAGGDVAIEGSVETAISLPSNRTALTIVSSGRILLQGILPYNTILAVESQTGRGTPAIVGVRGQTFQTAVTFDYGVPAGAGFTARGCTTWRRMPADRDGGILRLVEADPGIHFSWQTVAADPVDSSRPDLRPDRASRPKPARDGEWIPVEPGSFVRLRLEAEIGAGRTLPRLQELRLVDR